MKQFYFASLFLGLSLFINAQTPTGNSTEVGITEGQLSVSLSGAATYNIPIMVTPGINGVVPQISLAYNSQGGNGTVGYGWNIAGVSKITRIPSTKYHDGTIDPVDFDNLDRFALDGQRLIVKTGTYGTYGANGTQYETENFSNVKITSYGVHPSGAAYGPAYFLVEYPDGSKAYYGNSTDSISIMEYGVTYWENPQGVRINYTYTLTNNVLNIATVGYGSQNTNPSINFTKFIYKTRLRAEQYYIGGQSFTNDQILDQIQVSSLGPLYRTYQLAYNSNTLGYERLISVTEQKGGDSSISYNPTVFTYEDTPDSMSYTTITASLNVGNITSLNTGTISGDFSGDEKMEFIVYPTTGTSSKAKYWLYSNISSGNTNIGYEHNVGVFESVFPTSWLSLDNKLMPKQGWTVAKKTDINYTFTIYSADPVHTILEQYNRIVNFPIQPSGSGCYADKIIPKNILSGDFNGDGLTDVIAIDNTCSSKKVYFVDLKRDNTANFLTYSGELLVDLAASSKVEVADVNGDGKSDFMVFENGKVTSYTLNDASQLVLLWDYSDTNISTDSSKTILLGDYNGDAKTDFIIPGGYGSSTWYRYTSTGTGFVKTETNTLTYMQNNATNTYSYMASDYNRDEKSDLILTKSDRNAGNTAGSLTITSYENRNGNFSSAYYITASSPYVADINLNSLPVYLPTGKGITSKDKPYNPALEIAFLGNNKIFYFNSNKDNTQDQLVRSITTGNGVKESITYKPLNTDSSENNNTIYIPGGSTENYPNTDILSASTVQVVTKLEKQSAANYKKQLFSYYGAVSNLQGLGFLGFRATMRTNWHDDSNPIISSVAKNDINLRGANIENYTALGYASPSSNTPTTFIAKSVLTYESQLLASKVFILKNTIAQQYNGLEDTSTEATVVYDNYNNPTQSITLVKEGGTTQQTTINNITYDVPTSSPYVVGRPINKIQSVTISGDTMTSEEQYAYSTGGLLTQVKKKGHNTNFITEDYEYDGFGNSIKKTITATGLTPRVTNYEYKATMYYYGRFLTESTDAEGLKTAYEYNLMNGTLTSKNKQTELNSWNNAIKTYYSYDYWCKKTKTTDYLGKSNTYSYTRSNEKSKTIITGDDGSYSEELSNDLGQKLTASVKDLNGNISSVSYLYDIYGRNFKVSEPYSGTSATQWNETKYDVYGRPTQSISFTGKTTTISYSGLTTTVSEGAKTKVTTRNAIGNVVSITDTPGGTITYTYFANGNLKSSNYDGTTTTIEQDGWGRKTKLIDPSAGTYTYTYNDFGEVLTETSPNGTTTYTLDAVGKLTQKTITGTNTNSTTTYAYDSTTKLPTLSTFVNASDNNATTTTAYTYDATKRLASSVETTPYATFTKQLTYDAFGRVNTETSTAGAAGKTSSKTIQHTYKNGSYWQLKDNTTQQALWQTNTVNARGQLLTANLGNGIAITNGYDTYGFAYTIRHYKASTNADIMVLATGFDAQKGNLTFRYNSMFSWNESFTYDALDRLTSYKNASGSVITQGYDDSGRITQNELGTYNYTNTTKKYQNTSVTVTPEALTYYQAKPLQTISYNAFKSPVEITEQNGADRINFTYNDNNNRSTMFYGNTNTDKNLRLNRKYYSADGSMEIKVNTQTGVAEFVTYIGGNGYTAPIILKSNGSTQNYLYLHRDYQGSILAITDAAGAVVEKRLFDAWGSLINYYNASGAPFGGWGALDRGYTGHEHLQSVGLIHMNGRLYDPKLHRFLQTDNYVQDPGNTQNYNRYGYVLNNPLKYTDPSGWLTEVQIAEERLKAQRAEEDIRERGKSMLDWYAQHSGIGADGITSQQWASLGGAGVNSQQYHSYVNQNREEYKNGLNYGMQQIEEKYQFFDRLRNHYEGKSGNDFNLTTKEFKYLINNGEIDYAKAVKIDDNTYKASINFYDSDTDLKLSFGRATITYRIENNKYVYSTFYDKYDFDSKPWGTRSVINEIITRTYNSYSDGKTFNIYYNKR